MIDLQPLNNQKNNKSKLRILSYNTQVGIPTSRYRHYFTRSWRHVFPFPGRLKRLSNIAHLMRDFDMVGLLELDGGSFRSGFVNHADYLSEKATFPFGYDKINRNLGIIAKHAMGVFTRLTPAKVSRHSLPGKVRGRGALALSFGDCDNSLEVILTHLALGTQSRIQQVHYLSEMMAGHRNVILMGDLNFDAESKEMDLLRKNTDLCIPLARQSALSTYPSWEPKHHIDHILVSPSIKVEKIQVLNYPVSDHLPIAMEATLPDTINLNMA